MAPLLTNAKKVQDGTVQSVNKLLCNNYAKVENRLSTEKGRTKQAILLLIDKWYGHCFCVATESYI